jgi:hypothetical protein
MWGTWVSYWRQMRVGGGALAARIGGAWHGMELADRRRRLRGIVGEGRSVTPFTCPLPLGIHIQLAHLSLSLFRFGPKPLPKCKRKPLVVALALKCGVRLDYPRTPIIKSKVGRFRFGRDKPRTGERAAATSNFPLFYLRNRER